MNFFKKLFRKKQEIISLEEQIKNEIFNCDKALFDYQKDIYEIKKMASELIHNTLFVPQNFWYEELDNIDKISQLAENQKITTETINDIKQLCSAYKQQIELRQKKIEVCKNNRDRLRKMLQNEQKLTQSITQELNKEDILQQHKNLLNNIEDNHLQQEIETAEKIKIFKDEIKKLQDELLLKKEFNRQLQILYKKYGQSTDIQHIETYLNELKKLTEEDK